jgi:hypothetical protein
MHVPQHRSTTRQRTANGEVPVAAATRQLDAPHLISLVSMPELVPLVSEPPLGDASPLTSEPPLASEQPLTSEPTAICPCGDEDGHCGEDAAGA